MAINPSSAYSGQVDTTDSAGYPYGRAHNEAIIGDGTGTPLEEKWVSDLFGFEQALLGAAGLTPSGTPDKVGASQYLDAIKSVADARARLSVQRAQAINWPERPSFANTSAANSSVPVAWDPAPSSQGYSGNTGLFMVVTQDTKSVTSDDGNLWRNPVSYGGILSAAAYDLAAGNSGGVRSFLASQLSGGNLMRTTDAGTTWTVVASGLPTSSVLCNGPGSVWVASGTFGAIQRSTDGLSWSSSGITVTGSWGFGPKRIVWNGSLFVMISANATYGECLTSPDGLAWTARTLPAVTNWNGLAYSADDGLWMAVAGSGAVAVSADGVTWTARAVPPIGMTDLAVVGSAWVAPIFGGQLGGINYSCDRGVTWKQVAVGNHRTANGWSRVIAGDNRFLAVHATGTALEFALSARSY